MSNNTRYVVVAGSNVIDVKAKKATAIEIARVARDAQNVNVAVATMSGLIVFAQDAPKKINMSKPFTRVVEGVVAPEGWRVAYVRTRKGVAALHRFSDDGSEYAVLNLTTGKIAKGRFATSRDVGKVIRKAVEVNA